MDARICKTCGKKFRPTKNKQMTCSAPCYWRIISAMQVASEEDMAERRSIAGEVLAELSDDIWRQVK